MNQPQNSHSTLVLATFGALATGLVGTLLTITLGSASAMPGRDDHAPVPASAPTEQGHYVERGCFITPHTLNAAVLEALPRCYAYVP
jgi:hypothetical protein